MTRRSHSFPAFLALASAFCLLACNATESPETGDPDPTPEDTSGAVSYTGTIAAGSLTNYTDTAYTNPCTTKNRYFTSSTYGDNSTPPAAPKDSAIRAATNLASKCVDPGKPQDTLYLVVITQRTSTPTTPCRSSSIEYGHTYQLMEKQHYTSSTSSSSSKYTTCSGTYEATRSTETTRTPVRKILVAILQDTSYTPLRILVVPTPKRPANTSVNVEFRDPQDATQWRWAYSYTDNLTSVSLIVVDSTRPAQSSQEPRLYLNDRYRLTFEDFMGFEF